MKYIDEIHCEFLWFLTNNTIVGYFYYPIFGLPVYILNCDEVPLFLQITLLYRYGFVSELRKYYLFLNI